MFSAVTDQGKYLYTPNLVHRKTKSSGISLPKIVLQESGSDEKGRAAGISVPLIGGLHYTIIHIAS